MRENAGDRRAPGFMGQLPLTGTGWPQVAASPCPQQPADPAMTSLYHLRWSSGTALGFREGGTACCRARWPPRSGAGCGPSPPAPGAASRPLGGQTQPVLTLLPFQLSAKSPQASFGFQPQLDPTPPVAGWSADAYSGGACNTRRQWLLASPTDISLCVRACLGESSSNTHAHCNQLLWRCAPATATDQGPGRRFVDVATATAQANVRQGGFCAAASQAICCLQFLVCPARRGSGPCSFGPHRQAQRRQPGGSAGGGGSDGPVGQRCSFA